EPRRRVLTEGRGAQPVGNDRLFKTGSADGAADRGAACRSRWQSCDLFERVLGERASDFAQPLMLQRPAGADRIVTGGVTPLRNRLQHAGGILANLRPEILPSELAEVQRGAFQQFNQFCNACRMELRQLVERTIREVNAPDAAVFAVA